MHAMKTCFQIAEYSLTFAKTVQTSAMKTCFQIAEYSLASAKTVQTSAMKTCFQIAECSLASANIQNLAPPLQVFRGKSGII